MRRHVRIDRLPRRRSGRLWSLLALLLTGTVVALLAGRRRGRPAWNREDEPRFAPPPQPASPTSTNVPASAPDVAVWIAGPAGNLYVRDGGPADGLPVLFLHSLGGNGGQWALQLDHLRSDRRGRRGRRAAALDLRGHGESDPADDGDYTLPALAADVAAAADQLDLRHFVLAGHSLGAAVAIEYAAKHPERVAGLLLVDPNGDQTRLPRQEVDDYLAAVRRDPYGELDRYFKQLLLRGDRAAAGWVLEDLRATHEDALVRAFEAAAERSPLPALTAYAGPKLSIVSDMNDIPISLHRLQPDLPVRHLPGTGHWLMVDRPELFNHLLDEFLERVDGRR
jgi:pimeloyl-ACP methyl ester carboxylesterase